MHVRSLFAVVVAALLAGPVSAHAANKAQAKSAGGSTSSAQAFSVGGWIGYENGDLSGLQLRAEGSMPYRKLTPEIQLSFVGSIGYSYLTDSGNGIDITDNVLKFVPAARFTYGLNPQIDLFGDAGLGLYYAHRKAEATFFGVTQSASDSTTGFMLRFGVGGFYKLNPSTNLGVSLYLDPMFGDYDDTTFSILAGATFRI